MSQSQTSSIPGSVEWWHARHTTTVRRRPRRDGLTLERILDVALDVLRGEGLDALTMRRLAAELGTGHTSLYRHVASREELLVELVDHVLGDVHVDPAVTGWRPRAEANARALRRALLAHPALVPLMTAGQLLGPNALRSREDGLRIMRDAGADEALAVHAYLLVARFVIGSAMLDTGGAARTAGARRAMTRLFRSLPEDEYPTIRALAATLNDEDSDAEFERGLGTILDGIAAALTTA